MTTFAQSSFAAGRYAAFRPSYHSQRLAQNLLGYHTGQQTRALDVATGTGQVATSISSLFSHIDAIDASTSMLTAANTTLPNISYALGTAEKLNAEDQFYDAITVAQALHWFDRPRFFSESLRVLKPNGTLMILGYTFHKHRHPASREILLNYALGTLGAYWESGREYLDQHYIGVEKQLLEHGFVDIQRREWNDLDSWDNDTCCLGLWNEKGISRQMSLDQLQGYLSTWSSYKRWCDAGNNPNIVRDCVAAIGKAEGVHSDDPQEWTRECVDVAWEQFIILARRP